MKHSNKFREAFRKAMDELIKAFKKLGQQLSTVFSATYQKWEQVYLQHHKCLPGSNRTTRLRKKRVTRVVAWYIKTHFENIF